MRGLYSALFLRVACSARGGGFAVTPFPGRGTLVLDMVNVVTMNSQVLDTGSE